MAYIQKISWSIPDHGHFINPCECYIGHVHGQALPRQLKCTINIKDRNFMTGQMHSLWVVCSVAQIYCHLSIDSSEKVHHKKLSVCCKDNLCSITVPVSL